MPPRLTPVRGVELPRRRRGDRYSARPVLPLQRAERARRLGAGGAARLRHHRRRRPAVVARSGAARAGAVPAGVEVHHLHFHEVTAVDGEAPHETAFQQMMTEKPDGRGHVGRGRGAVHDRGVPAIPDAATARNARAPGYFVTRRRPSGARALFRGQGPHRFRRGCRPGGRRRRPRRYLADFLRSNEAVPRLREAILKSVRERGERTDEELTFAEARLTDAVLGVQPEYLDAARHTIDEEFGSLGGYLRDSGITAADVEQLGGVLLG